MSKKIKFIAIFLATLFLVMGVFDYFFLSLNQAQGANNYIDDIVFYCGSDTKLHLSFHTKTTFSTVYNFQPWYNSLFADGLDAFVGYVRGFRLGGVDSSYTFTAGNNYDFQMSFRTVGGVFSPDSCNNFTSNNYIYRIGNTTNNHYPIFNPVWEDNQQYYFTEYPSLTLTFPTTDDIEISGNFNITGTITQPSPYEYNQLMTYAYLYNPLGPYDEIGVFTIPLLATSTQQFSQPIIGLPISNPNNIILINELQYLNPETETITKTYRQGSGTEFPWQIRMTTFAEGEAPEYPFDPPIWPNYFDIYRPTASSDGYYRLTTPTSTIEFVYNFPETYKVRITQDEAEKLATSTFATVDPDGNLRFTVANFDASTSTIKWVEANVYNASDNLIITALFPIIGLEAGAQENIGIWGQIESFIKGLLTKFFFPSTAVIDKFQTTIPNIVKSKIPISYFYEIKGIIEGANIATSTTPFPSVEVDLGGQMVDIKLIDFSYLEEQGYMATLKNLMRIFLWGMFFMYLYALGTAGPKQLQMKF